MQGDQSRKVKFCISNHVGCHGSSGSKMLLDEHVKLSRQHMEWNAELAKRIQQDEIIGSFVTIEIHAAVALDQPDLIGLAQPEIFLSRRNDAGVEFHHIRSEEHTSELQSLRHLVCRLLLE